MRLAITNPTTWPRVRRGAERFVNELAAYMAQRGHEVTLISSKPGPSEITHQRGYTTVCYRRLWHPRLAKIGLLEFHPFFFTSLYALLRKRYDAVLCLTFMDGYAASLARSITGTPCVFAVNGLPLRVQYFRSLSMKGAVFGRAIEKADTVIAFSHYLQSYLEGRWGRACARIAIPVDINRFRPDLTSKSERPSIVCAAALSDTRKGGRLLMRAFDRLKIVRPDAVLKIAAPLPPALEEEFRALVSSQYREDVHFLGDAHDDVPALFSSAWVSVLPSIWEPYGMVVLESLAAGTPVIGARDGALPELIANNAIGRLFDPGDIAGAEPTNVAGLTEALLEGLDLGRRPETAQRCRSYAEQFSWEAIGPSYERLFEELARGRRVPATQAKAAV